MLFVCWSAPKANSNRWNAEVASALLKIKRPRADPQFPFLSTQFHKVIQNPFLAAAITTPNSNYYTISVLPREKLWQQRSTAWLFRNQTTRVRELKLWSKAEQAHRLCAQRAQKPRVLELQNSQPSIFYPQVCSKQFCWHGLRLKRNFGAEEKEKFWFAFFDSTGWRTSPFNYYCEGYGF